MAEEFEIEPLHHHRQAKRHDEGVDMARAAHRAIGQKLDQQTQDKTHGERHENG